MSSCFCFFCRNFHLCKLVLYWHNIIHHLLLWCLTLCSLCSDKPCIISNICIFFPLFGSNQFLIRSQPIWPVFSKHLLFSFINSFYCLFSISHTSVLIFIISFFIWIYYDSANIISFKKIILIIFFQLKKFLSINISLWIS